MVTFFRFMEARLKTETAERLKRIGEEAGAFLEGQFTLSSGGVSNYYFDAKKITLLPEGAYLVGKVVLELLGATKVDAIGGLAIGADPIVTAVALVSHLEGRPIPAFIVRAEAKKHGTQDLITGHLPKGGNVVIVDDVITEGKSIFRAIDAVEAEGCKVVKVIVLLDRRAGGSDKLRKRGYDFATVWTYAPSGKVVVEQ